jgi:hypothetical protein
MSSIITFAANNDLFRKRKRVYRACESCKKRRVSAATETKNFFLMMVDECRNAAHIHSMVKNKRDSLAETARHHIVMMTPL